MTERVLQLANECGEHLTVRLPVLIDHLVTHEGLLQLVEERADRSADLLGLHRGEFPGQVKAIKVVVLDQRVRGIDKGNTADAGLQQGQVLLLVLVVTAHTEQDLEGGELPLQRCDDTVVGLALVQIERGVGRLQFVGLFVNIRISVDQMRAEGQGRLDIGDTNFAEAWEEGET